MAKTAKTPNPDEFTAKERAVIAAMRQIPGDARERSYRALSVVEYIRSLAEGMRSAHV